MYMIKRKICQHQYHYDGVRLKENNKIRKSLGLSPIVPETKKCLRCEKEFISFGKNNRMCGNCSTYSASNFTFFDDEYSI